MRWWIKKKSNSRIKQFWSRCNNAETNSLGHFTQHAMLRLCGQNENGQCLRTICFFSVYSKRREFRKWMPLIITLFGSCCHFFLSLLMLHRLCVFFHYLHSLKPHREEKKHNKNCANTVDLFSTAGALVINLVQTKRSKWKQFAECNL